MDKLSSNVSTMMDAYADIVPDLNLEHGLGFGLQAEIEGLRKGVNFSRLETLIAGRSASGLAETVESSSDKLDELTALVKVLIDQRALGYGEQHMVMQAIESAQATLGSAHKSSHDLLPEHYRYGASPLAASFSEIRSEAYVYKSTQSEEALERMRFHADSLRRTRDDAAELHQMALEDGDDELRHQFYRELRQLDTELTAAERALPFYVRHGMVEPGFDLDELTADIRRFKLDPTEENRARLETYRDLIGGFHADILLADEVARASGDVDARRDIQRELGRVVSASKFLDGEFAPGLFERLGIPDPGIDTSMIRADARYGRSLVREGRELPEDFREQLSDYHDRLDAHVRNLQDQYEYHSEQYRVTGEGEHLDLLKELAKAIPESSNLKAELTAVMEAGMDRQGSSVNKVMSFVGSTLATLGVAQWASRRFIQEPYRFETQPQLQTIANQGQLGALIGSAYGELEAYKQEVRQTTFNLGAGATAAGIGMLAGGGSPWARGVGGVLSLVGAGGMLSGLLGDPHSLIEGKFGFTSEEEIIAQAVAKQATDPSGLISRFQSSRVGLQNIGADLSFADSRFATGNAALQQLADAGLYELGYQDSADLGRLLSSATMAGRFDDYLGAAELAGQLSLFGVSEDAALSMMGTASRAGLSDVTGSLSRHAGVFAEEDGSLSNYSMNVLVPALMKVTESMALQNLARSSEEIESLVTNFWGNAVQSDTRLGELARSQPEIFGSIMSSLSAAGDVALSTPSVMAHMMATAGLTPEDAYRRPELFGLAGIRNINSVFDISAERSLDTQAGTFAMGYLSLMGLDPRQSIALLELAQENPELLDPRVSPDALGEGIMERYEAIFEDPLSSISRTLAEQSDKYLELQTSLIPQLVELQEAVLGFLLDDNVQALMREFVKETISGLAGTPESSRDEFVRESRWYDDYFTSMVVKHASRTFGGEFSADDVPSLLNSVESALLADGVAPRDVTDLQLLELFTRWSEDLTLEELLKMPRPIAPGALTSPEGLFTPSVPEEEIFGPQTSGVQQISDTEYTFTIRFNSDEPVEAVANKVLSRLQSGGYLDTA